MEAPVNVKWLHDVGEKGVAKLQSIAKQQELTIEVRKRLPDGPEIYLLKGNFFRLQTARAELDEFYEALMVYKRDFASNAQEDAKPKTELNNHKKFEEENIGSSHDAKQSKNTDEDEDSDDEYHEAPTSSETFPKEDSMENVQAEDIYLDAEFYFYLQNIHNTKITTIEDAYGVTFKTSTVSEGQVQVSASATRANADEEAAMEGFRQISDQLHQQVRIETSTLQDHPSLSKDSVDELIKAIRNQYTTVYIQFNEDAKIIHFIGEKPNVHQARELFDEYVLKRTTNFETHESASASNGSKWSPSSFGVSQSPVPTTEATSFMSPEDKRMEFSLNESLTVYVYNADIVHQETDIIVNAANKDLNHGAGVAAAIADAAGPDLVEDCAKLIQLHEEIPVGSVVHSRPGRLKCKFVIHTVGPRYDEYQTSDECYKVMVSTFYDILVYANNTLGGTSISIPAISSGKYM